MSERLYTIAAVAELLSLGRSTVYRLIARKQLRVVTVAGRMRVPESAVDELIKEGTAQ